MNTKALSNAGAKVGVTALGFMTGLLACQKGGEMLTKDGQPATAVTKYAPASACVLTGGYLHMNNDNPHIQNFGQGLAAAGLVKIVHTVANDQKPDSLKYGLGNPSARRQGTQFVPFESMFPELDGADDDDDNIADSTEDDDLEGLEGEDMDLGDVPDDMELGYVGGEVYRD